MNPEWLCRLCEKKERCVLFLDCAHLIFCAECATDMKKCAVCHADVSRQITVYREVY